MGVALNSVEVSRSGLSFRRFGTPGESPLLLLHGIPGCGASWHGVAELLREHFYIIVPDLLGFGESARPLALEQLHAEAQSKAVLDLLDELGIADPAVAAHDFGGPIALMMSAARPGSIGSLALFATNTFSDTPIPFPLSLVNAPVLGDMAARMLFSAPSLGMMLKFGVGTPRPELNVSAAIGDAAQVRAIATIFAGSLTQLRQLYGPVEAQLHSFRGRTFVGWGDRDPFFNVDQGRRTATALGATFRIYPGAGHFLPDERPNEIAADLGAFLNAT